MYYFCKYFIYTKDEIMKNTIKLFFLTALVTLGLISCSEPYIDLDIDYFTVSYNGNDHKDGIVPIDSKNYEQEQTITVLDNVGDLTKPGYSFVGWNTAPDGSGITYTPSQTFSMEIDDVILYAKWSSAIHTVTYVGNGNEGGNVPIDPATYEQGQTITVLDNTGNLTKPGYSFSGWNTASNGSGTTYTSNQTFSMETGNVTLYAKWTSTPTYTLTYNGNGNDGGIVPIDPTSYEQINNLIL